MTQVDVYDGDLHVRCLHTPSYPSAVCFLCAPLCYLLCLLGFRISN